MTALFSPCTSLVILILAASLPLFSQNKVVEKANEHFKYSQFAEAAELYEQALQEMDEQRKSSRSTGTLKTKLAYCYRMNNKMDKAETLYAEAVKDENVKAETYLFYGEALMSNGKYEEAKKWFLDFAHLEPGDERGRLMVEACDKAPSIQPYFQYVEITEFPYNSPADDNAPAIWQGGIVFSSDRKSGLKLMKEKSGWTGRDYLDLYFCEKTAEGGYSEPKQFSGKLSEVNKNTGNASFSADGREVFFTRNDNELNRQETYNLQLFRAETTGGDRWKNVEKLPFCTPAYNYMHPAISPDGQALFFVSNRAGGEGGTDLWVAKRKNGTWEKPENLGPVLNTSANEGFPFLDTNGRLFFCSKGHPGYGGFDIFVTGKDEKGNWKTPVNLGKPINSSLDDISIYIAPDGQGGIFTSSRNGGDDDIFLFTVLNEIPVETVREETTVYSTTGEKEMEKPVLSEDIFEDNFTKENESVLQQTTEPQALEESAKAEILTASKEEEIIPAEAIAGKKPAGPAPVGQQATTEPMVEMPKPNNEISSEQEVKSTEEKIESLEIQALLPSESLAPEEEQKATEPEVDTTTFSGLPSEEPANRPPGTAPAPVAIFEIEAVALDTASNRQPASPERKLSSFQDFERKVREGTLNMDEHFRITGAYYDANVWQLTPRISSKLDKLAELMKRYPALEIEIGAYTESLGDNNENLILSQLRAQKAVEYMVREGISEKRLTAKGYGETAPLNHCVNEMTCSMEEHLVNQRLEIRILSK